MKTTVLTTDSTYPIEEIISSAIETEIESSPGFYEDLPESIQIEVNHIYGKRASGYGSYYSVVSVSARLRPETFGFDFEFVRFHNDEDRFEMMNEPKIDFKEEVMSEIERAVAADVSDFLLKVLKEKEEIEEEEETE